MKKYTCFFSGIYILFYILLIAIAVMLKVKGSAGFSFIAAFCASYLAGWKFNKDQAREPTPEEKKSFIWQALAAVMVISLLFYTAIIAVVFTQNDILMFINEMSLPVVIGVITGGIILISIIYYLIIRWGFSKYKNEVKKNEKPIKAPDQT